MNQKLTLRSFFVWSIGKYLLTSLLILILACKKDCMEPDCGEIQDNISNTIKPTAIEGKAIKATFGDQIDPENLPNYANQFIPAYIIPDNSDSNPVTDVGAILGRVLFYDKQLSIDNTVSCSSCHQQSIAFSDSEIVSKGVQGSLTERHSMRLVNARFGVEKKFFWDERAATLEAQTTMPIHDHAELGYSGEDGRPDFGELIQKLEQIDYYQELFTMAFGDPKISEGRMQIALAQFVRSIQSFDSKYDEGYDSNFSNFSVSEKLGMRLFETEPRFNNDLTLRNGGGLGCFICHQPPTFSINPSSGNNGVIGVANQPSEIDIDNTRAPSIRDVFNPNGELNGPMMHDGSVQTVSQLIQELGFFNYDPRNTKLDTRIQEKDFSLNITQKEKEDLIAFLKTLTGSNLYTDEKWSDPF